MTFQFVHCRSFRVPRRPCLAEHVFLFLSSYNSYKTHLYLNEVMQDKHLCVLSTEKDLILAKQFCIYNRRNTNNQYYVKWMKMFSNYLSNYLLLRGRAYSRILRCYLNIFSASLYKVNNASHADNVICTTYHTLILATAIMAS